MPAPYKVGQMLYMQPIQKGKQEPETFKARIADIHDDHVAIELPLSEKTGRIGIFASDAKVDVWFFHQDGNKYFFPGKLIGRKKEQIPMLMLAHPSDDQVVKSQRRQYLRVPAQMELALHPVKEGAFEPLLVRTIDISGGGCSFRLGRQHPGLEMDQKIRWWLSLVLSQKEVLHPSGQGQVVRVFKEKESAVPYVYSLKFTDVADKNQQKIVRYCFYRQLELNKKGLKL